MDRAVIDCLPLPSPPCPGVGPVKTVMEDETWAWAWLQFLLGSHLSLQLYSHPMSPDSPFSAFDALEGPFQEFPPTNSQLAGKSLTLIF